MLSKLSEQTKTSGIGATRGDKIKRIKLLEDRFTYSN